MSNRKFKFLSLKHSLRIVLIGIVASLLIAVFTGVTLMTNTITIHDGDTVYDIKTTQTDPAKILTDQEISLAPQEYFEFTEIKKRAADLYVIRPFEVQFTDAAVTQQLVMTSGTVQDVLDVMDVTLSEDDILSIDPTTALVPNMVIDVTRVGYEEYQETEVIPFESNYSQDKLSAGDYLTLLTEGVDGIKTLTYQNQLINGEIVDTVLVSEEITTEPVTETYEFHESPVKLPSSVVDDPSFEMGRVSNETTNTTKVHVGSKYRYYDEGEAPVELDENGVPLNYIYKVNGTASAYSNFGRPTKLAPGCVAMNQAIFPFGTSLYIRTPDGDYVYGYSKVADDGKAVNDGKVLVDVFFDTYEESCQFGLKEVEVYVLDYKEPKE